MAMTGQQQNGWSAGTGSSLTPDQLNLLVLGTLATVLILFFAWSVVQAYRGVSARAVSWRQFQELLIRNVVLLLITLFFFFH